MPSRPGAGFVVALLALLAACGPDRAAPADERGTDERGTEALVAEDGGRWNGGTEVLAAEDGGTEALAADADLLAAFAVETDREGPLPSGLLARVRARDPGGALEALERLPTATQASTEARYLRGRLLEELGRGLEAAAAFELDPDSLPTPVARDAAWRRGRLLAEGGRCVEARPLLIEVARGPGSDHARLAAARCALALGEGDAAIAELRPLTTLRSTTEVGFAARRSLAEAQAAAGRVDEARGLLRDLLLERPEHAEAGEIEARLRALRAEPALTPAERTARAELLLERRRFTEAVDELDRAGRPSRRAQRARWLHLRGVALFRSRHGYEEAARVLAEAARYGGPNAVEAEFLAARALSRADRDAEAVAAYDRLVRAHPTSPWAARAEYLAAWLQTRHGLPDGPSRLEAFLAGPRARLVPGLLGEALWHLGFSAYRRGRFVVAAGHLGRYAQTDPGAMVRARGLYWQGRALEAHGRTGPAASCYRGALAVEPLHWYALLARSRLAGLGQESGEPLPGRGPAASLSAEPPQPLLVTLPSEVAFYHSVGFDEDAVAALERDERSVRAAAPRGRNLEALVEAHLRLGGARRAFLLAGSRRDALRSRPTPATLWVWRAAYPRPLEGLVTREARVRGLEPAHVWATMRQESGYAPGVVSRADAVGLLQLLPSTARTVGRAMGLEVTREMLFDPAWNVRIGVAEIAGLHESLGRQLPLTVAAYNAGEHRVRRWLAEAGAEAGPVELDLFVERIPFDETRGYVRRVISHYARYRYLEDPAAGWPVELPARVSAPAGRAPQREAAEPVPDESPDRGPEP